MTLLETLKYARDLLEVAYLGKSHVTLIELILPIEEQINLLESSEPVVWFCPDCGTISEAQTRCCPDWIRSRKVTKNFAESCRATFLRCVAAPQPKAEPVQEPVAYMTEDGRVAMRKTVESAMQLVFLLTGTKKKKKTKNLEYGKDYYEIESIRWLGSLR